MRGVVYIAECVCVCRVRIPPNFVKMQYMTFQTVSPVV